MYNGYLYEIICQKIKDRTVFKNTFGPVFQIVISYAYFERICAKPLNNSQVESTIDLLKICTKPLILYRETRSPFNVHLMIGTVYFLGFIEIINHAKNHVHGIRLIWF